MAGRATGTPNPVATLYQSVINDVINNVREAFLDDGVDEQVLQELKTTWEHKVQQSKAIENPTPQHRLAPGIPVSYVHHTGMPKIMPVGSQSIQLTPSGQQATIALPNVMAAKYQLTGPTQAHLYTPYQSGQQILVHQPNTKASVATQEQESSSDLSQPSVLIQSDGASDICSLPCCSKTAPNNLMEASKEVEIKPGCDKTLSKKTMTFVLRKTKKSSKSFMSQVDGRVDSSSDEFDDDDDDDDDEDEDDDEETDRKELEPVIDDDPLCSDDDVGTDEDPEELFDTDNVIVCQYDKIHRTKCRWKFNLKLGIMNLNGHDMVFQKATGEAEW